MSPAGNARHIRNDSTGWYLVRFLPVVFICSCGLLVAAASSEAATYYVAATDGSDGHSCTQAQSIITPKATIQAGVNCIEASGDMIIVRDGIYTGVGTMCTATPIVCVTAGGLPGNPVTVMAENPCVFPSGAAPICGAILDGQNLRSAGFVVWGTVSYVRIEGFEIRGVVNDAINLNNFGSDFEVVGNYIHDTGRVCSNSAFGKAGVYTSRPGTSITQNVMHSIGRFANGENGCPFTIVNLDHGIYANGASSLFVANNTFYDFTRGWAIQLYSNPMRGVRIVNNTFALPHPSREGHVLVGASLTDCDISGNVSYNPVTAFLRSFGRVQHSGCTVRNNVIYGAELWTSVPAGVTNAGNEIVR